MGQAETKCSFIVVLFVLVNIFREVVGPVRIYDSVSLDREACLESIRHNFRADEYPIQSAKSLAQAAILVLRILNNPEQYNTFENDGLNAARDYFLEIFQFITCDTPLEINVYCNKFGDTHLTNCIEQLTADYEEIVGNPENAFHSIYHNKIYDEIPPNHGFSKVFLKDIAIQFKTDDSFPMPESFCNQRYKE